MNPGNRPPIDHYFALTYPYTVVPDDDSYFIEFPDLPGCVTQVDDAVEIAEMAEEIRLLWIETAYEQGEDIPEPSNAERYSGKFLARVPKTLHRDLVMQAQREGMSLNAWVGYLLAERNMVARLSSRFEAMESRVEDLDAHRNYDVNIEQSRSATGRRKSKPGTIVKFRKVSVA